MKRVYKSEPVNQTPDPWVNLLIAVIERARMDADGRLNSGRLSPYKRRYWQRDAARFLQYITQEWAFTVDTPLARRPPAHPVGRMVRYE